MIGTCIWFAKNNRNDNGERPIRKCKYGSLCKYPHFTGEECQYIQDHFKDVIDCENCKFKYQPYEENEDIQAKIRREMPCLVCNDTRKVPARRRFQKKVQMRNWCECNKKAGVRLYSGNSHPSGEKDTWVCNNCNCISQVG